MIRSYGLASCTTCQIDMPIPMMQVVMEGGSATVGGAVAGAVFGALAGYRFPHRNCESLH